MCTHAKGYPIFNSNQKPTFTARYINAKWREQKKYFRIQPWRSNNSASQSNSIGIVAIAQSEEKRKREKKKTIFPRTKRTMNWMEIKINGPFYHKSYAVAIGIAIVIAINANELQ